MINYQSLGTSTIPFLLYDELELQQQSGLVYFNNVMFQHLTINLLNLQELVVQRLNFVTNLRKCRISLFPIFKPPFTNC